jgi:hypothetical protein
MNKIYALAIMLLLSCSDGDKFNEEEHNEIFIDWAISKDTLYLYGGLDLLQNFFWVIDGDTTYIPKKRISYGEHTIQLYMIDIWGDTLIYSETIILKEPFGVTLLSPVDKFLANDDFIEFQYKVNGASEETQVLVYFCIGEHCYEEDSDSVWEILDGNILLLNEDIFSQKKIFWLVEACEGEEKCIYSTGREIWLEG